MARIRRHPLRQALRVTIAVAALYAVLLQALLVASSPGMAVAAGWPAEALALRCSPETVPGHGVPTHDGGGHHLCCQLGCAGALPLLPPLDAAAVPAARQPSSASVFMGGEPTLTPPKAWQPANARAPPRA